MRLHGRDDRARGRDAAVGVVGQRLGCAEHGEHEPAVLPVDRPHTSGVAAPEPLELVGGDHREARYFGAPTGPGANPPGR